MAYCSECGGHNDETCLICEICGHDLSVADETMPKQAAVEDVPQENATEISSENQPIKPINGMDEDYAAPLEKPSGNDDETETYPVRVPKENLEEVKNNPNGHQFSQEEGQLGKGLIKPTQIQLGMDGYHFSYEKPNSHLSMAESFTEVGTAEKRVVNPDEANLASSNTSFKESIPEAAHFSGDSPGPEPEKGEDDRQETLVTEQVEIARETTGLDVPEQPFIVEMGAVEAGDLKTTEPPKEETEVPPAAEVLMTPEVTGISDEQTEYTILVGRQSWFGVPLPGTYHVTNRKVVVTDQNAQSQQINLDAIAQVILKQSMLAKLLGIGTVKLIPGAAGVKPLIIAGVVRPKELVKKIESLIQ